MDFLETETQLSKFNRVQKKPQETLSIRSSTSFWGFGGFALRFGARFISPRSLATLHYIICVYTHHSLLMVFD
jgi:hypothetical protein